MTEGSDEPKNRYLQYLEIVTGSLEEKKRYRRYKARIKRLPEGHRIAVEAMERYLMHFGPVDGAGAMEMYEDLADLFEQSVADATPIRDLFGDDPIEFAESFMANYPLGQYRARERHRFVSAVDRAVAATTPPQDRTE